MIDRTEERFGLKPKRLAADSAYGSAPTLDWLATFSRDDFNYKARDIYTVRPASF